MSSRTRALKKAGIKDLFVGMSPQEQMHLARRAGTIPDQKKQQSRDACRRPVSRDDA